MTPAFRAGLLAGCILGAAVTGFTMLLLRERPTPEPLRPAAPAADERVPRLQEENQRLTREVAQLRIEKSPPPKEEKAPEPAPAPPDLKTRFAKLSESGLAAFQSPDYGELLKSIKDTGKPAVEFLMGVLRTSTSATERFLAAALLEGTADASAVPALAEALKGDKDDIVRRMASHALAVLVAPAAEAPLRAAATGDADWGVRLNSAYGLAKLNHDDGLRILQQGYESPDTPSEYRLGILGGLADVAAPATAPLFRKILGDSQDATYLLMAIHALEKMKDAGSLPALQQLATSAQPDLVKQAATKAIDAIRK